MYRYQGEYTDLKYFRSLRQPGELMAAWDVVTLPGGLHLHYIVHIWETFATQTSRSRSPLRAF